MQVDRIDQTSPFYHQFVGRTVQVLTENSAKDETTAGITGNFVKMTFDQSFSPNQLIDARIVTIRGDLAVGAEAQS